MQIEAASVDSLRSRLKNLETQNRLTRRLGIGVLLLVSVVVLIAQARPETSNVKTLDANEFQLRDAAGRVRAKLWMVEGKLPTLMMMDDQGHKTAQLISSEEGAALWLLTPKSGETVYLSASQKTGLLITGPAGRLNLRADLDKTNPERSPGPSLRIEDNNGNSATLGRWNNAAAKDSRIERSSAASVVLADNGGVVWSAPN
jgi:hypothetical protein